MFTIGKKKLVKIPILTAVSPECNALASQISDSCENPFEAYSGVFLFIYYLLRKPTVDWYERAAFVDLDLPNCYVVARTGFMILEFIECLLPVPEPITDKGRLGELGQIQQF